MKRRSGLSVAIALTLTLGGCGGFVREIGLQRPQGPPVAIVDPDYLVLRPLSRDASPGATAAVIYRQTVYFHEAERILDLRHLDPRTVDVTEGTLNSHVITIATNEEGDRRLGEWTGNNLERQLGVFLDGRLIVAPVIKSKITGLVVLDGEFSKEEAEAVAARLQRGGAAG